VAAGSAGLTLIDFTLVAGGGKSVVVQFIKRRTRIEIAQNQEQLNKLVIAHYRSSINRLLIEGAMNRAPTRTVCALW
jgi:hypothetical protein